MPGIVSTIADKICNFFVNNGEEASAEEIASSIVEDTCLPVIQNLCGYVVELGSNQDNIAREAYNLIRELTWVREEIA